MHRQPDAFIQITLGTDDLDLAQHHRLGRQLGGHLFLAAAQDEGRHAAGEHVPTLVIIVFLDRVPKVFAKAGLVAEKAGQQEMKQRPQLAQVILHRRAGETQPVPRLQGAGHPGILRAGIFDVLGLVEDDEMPVRGGEDGFIVEQQRIRAQHEIVIRQALKMMLPLVAVQGQHFERGCEAGGLVRPVHHQARRRDHETGPIHPAIFLFQQEVRERLNGLAQPHVIGEHARQLVLAQELQPAHPFELVGPERRLQAGRRRDWFQFAHPAELAAQFAQGLAALPFPLRLGQGAELAGPRPVQPQPVLAIERGRFEQLD